MKTFGADEFKVRTEVFSRVVGYIRPVNQWNEGKQEEFRQRKLFHGINTKRNLPDMQDKVQGRGSTGMVDD